MSPRTLPPADQASPAYDLKDMKSPVLTGFALRTFMSLLESAAGSLLYPVIAWQSGLTQVGWANHFRSPRPQHVRPVSMRHPAYRPNP